MQVVSPAAMEFTPHSPTIAHEQGFWVRRNMAFSEAATFGQRKRTGHVAYGR
jgi:hypothetical protein